LSIRKFPSFKYCKNGVFVANLQEVEPDELTKFLQSKVEGPTEELRQKEELWFYRLPANNTPYLLFIYAF